MGEYTSIRFVASLTPLGIRMVEMLNRDHEWSEVLQLAYRLDENLFSAVSVFVSCPRHNFIPFGGMQAAPTGWYHSNRLTRGSWSVCCSFKCYGPELQAFLVVLPLIIESDTLVETYDETTDYKGLVTVIAEPVAAKWPHGGILR
jgi:hypothetical protein